MVGSELTWAYPQPEKNPYQLEWDHLIDAIRGGRASTGSFVRGKKPSRSVKNLVFPPFCLQTY